MKATLIEHLSTQDLTISTYIQTEIQNGYEKNFIMRFSSGTLSIAGRTVTIQGISGSMLIQALPNTRVMNVASKMTAIFPQINRHGSTAGSRNVGRIAHISDNGQCLTNRNCHGIQRNKNKSHAAET